jgi:hypothetical protein
MANVWIKPLTCVLGYGTVFDKETSWQGNLPEATKEGWRKNKIK